MNARNLKPARNLAFEPTHNTLPCVGWIAAIASDGAISVDFPGNPLGPLSARSIIDISTRDIEEHGNTPPVLLSFDQGDSSKPIITGLVRAATRLQHAADTPGLEGVLDGKRLLFSASQEIVLRCGQGSITLTADGRIVVKGTKLLSRASETNKIKGASVDIN